MSSLSTRKKMTLWASAVMSAALVLTGCSQSTTSAPAESTAPSSASSAPTTAASSSPSPSAALETSASPAAKVTLETHEIANGYFQLQMPSDWRLEALDNVAAQVHQDSTASFNIIAADGRELAKLRTGGAQILDANPMPQQATNTVFDSAGDGVFGSFNYAFISYDGQPDAAEMMLTPHGVDSATKWDARLDGLLYAGGSGDFSAALTNETKLPGVSDSLKGAERFKAYAQTDEYSDLKNTFLSFKQLKDVATAVPEAVAAGQCVGAKYSYELGDSGLSCDEAKEFLSQMLLQPVHTGTAAISGVGYCEVPTPTRPGSCQVESSKGTFDYSMK